MTDQELYSMKLHDEREIWFRFYVTRVPGGWLYRTDMEQGGGSWMASTTFVPFNNEFQG